MPKYRNPTLGIREVHAGILQPDVRAGGRRIIIFVEFVFDPACEMSDYDARCARI